MSGLEEIYIYICGGGEPFPEISTSEAFPNPTTEGCILKLMGD